jgi:hypothetical protein
MMDRNKFKTLVGSIKDNYDKGNAWLDTIPREVNSVFFDNPYVDSLHRINTVCLETIFDGYLRQEVEWFIYEWSADKDEGYRTITYPDGKKFVINTIDDFVEYLVGEWYLT